MATDWDEVRANFYAKDDVPPEWPAGVKPISINGLALLGVHPTRNRIYWDGQELVTLSRLATFERVLAVLATGSTMIIAAIQVFQVLDMLAM